MLSSCSAYFRRVLYDCSSKSPVIIMRDVPYAEMRSILQFIYRGEIHVPEVGLPSLLKTARLLEIRGLSDDLEKPSAGDGQDSDEHRSSSNSTKQPATRKRRRSSGGLDSKNGSPAADSAPAPSVTSSSSNGTSKTTKNKPSKKPAVNTGSIIIQIRNQYLKTASFCTGFIQRGGP